MTPQQIREAWQLRKQRVTLVNIALLYDISLERLIELMEQTPPTDEQQLLAWRKGKYDEGSR